jgi:hypothetical protein
MREGSREGGDVRTIVSGASEDKRPSDRSSAVGSLSGKSDLRTLPGISATTATGGVAATPVQAARA